MKKATVFGILAVLVACIAFGAGPSCAAEKFGVGWQPYYIDAYSPAVIQELGLTKKYLPGVEIEYQEGLHTALFAARLIAGRIHLGYGEIMPTNIVCSKRTEADIRQVVATSYSAVGQRCALLMARPDAPDFKNPEEAMQWLNGKIVATPFGSCAYKYLLLSFEKLGLKPAEFLNQGIEIISTNFRIKKIDAAAVWEPTAARVGNLAGEGIAKIVATGKVINNPDIGMMMMRGDFIDNKPELAKGWLKCELEAQRFIFDPKNREKAVEMIAKYAVGMPKRAIWFGLYGMIPEQAGGTDPKAICPFIINDEIKKYGQELYDFQYKQKLVPTEKPPANIADDHLTREVLQAAGLESPVGVIHPAPADQNPFK